MKLGAHPEQAPSRTDRRGQFPWLSVDGSDEDAVWAQRTAKQGVPVVWREFEAMPHCFAMLLESNNGAAVHHGEFAGFCKQVVEGGKVETNGVFIKAKTLERSEVDVQSGLTELTDALAEEHMRKGRERIEAKFKKGQDPAAERPML